MRVKELVSDRFQVVAVMNGDACPTESFLLDGEASTESARSGLLQMLERVAEEGLDGIPSKWVHEANKQEHIYEFIKGDLRLFFFKGTGRQITVCTTGVMKSGRKADKAALTKAAKYRDDYIAASRKGTLQVVSDET